MRKLAVLFFGFLPLFVFSQNVGIGTNTPVARLHVADSNVVFSAEAVILTPPVVVPPVLGAGTRLMWIPRVSAFRAGTVTGDQWNTSNIGNYSTAFGQNNIASGSMSTAFGTFTQADGTSSMVCGYLSQALGQFSLATGERTQASGLTSASFGVDTKAIGHFSLSAGQSTIARSYASTVLGVFNSDDLSYNPNASISTDPLLVLGNGTSNFDRSNALVVYKNGNTDINGYTQLGKSSEGAPAIKQKKIIGFNTPSSANPNSWTFVPHGVNASKILSISVLVTAPGGFDILPHSPDAGAIYTVNTDPTGGGAGPSIAIGVKSAVQSGNVMGRPIKILITYEE